MSLGTQFYRSQSLFQGWHVSKRTAVVLVSGTTKNQGKGKTVGKRRGPKAVTEQFVNAGFFSHFFIFIFIFF